MRSDAIIIVGVGFQDPTQMHLAQDNDVVYTLTPDRSDQPFGKSVLPGRGWCCKLVPDAHGDTIGRPVPVVNQLRTYWWCSSPRTGRQRMVPASLTARETGASFSKDKCVLISL